MSPVGYALVKRHEGYFPFPYICPAGLRTVGYGHVIMPGERFDKPLVGDQAEQILKRDMAKFERAVNRVVTVPLWPLQFDAVTSLTFNIGGGALQSSTLLKRVNAQRHAEVPDQFRRWVFAAGKRLRGLERRRADEAALYEKARP
jgi:lysozyme